MKRIERPKENIDSLIGKEAKTKRDNLMARTGLIEYRAWLAVFKNTLSLENSLIASLKGCRIPPAPTLFGPFRSWLYPKIFRSSNVMKATFKSTAITKTRKFKRVNIFNT